MVAFVANSVVAAPAAKKAKPKYVFFLIGDGMGLASMYSANRYMQLKGEDDRLVFSQFPNTGMIYTYSESSGVTDSAAAGTALACGEKTSNGTIGMLSNHTDTLESMAYMAKKSGKAVGIITSVSIDHATPAAFYGHQSYRGMAYEIAMDGLHTGFDLFGGSGFVEPISKKDSSLPEVYSSYEKAGYTILRGKDNLAKLASIDGKAVVCEREGVATDAFAYAIDKSDADMQVEDVVEFAFPFLKARGGKSGFFVMVEGGKIDWANHSNDLATSLGETFSFDKVVEAAYKFYQQYPNETLIVVTADHDTGAHAIVANDNPALTLVDCQTMSQGVLEKKVIEMQMAGKSWDDMREFLTKNFGFWDKIAISLDDEYELRKDYAVKGETKAHYDQQGGLFASKVVSIVNGASSLHWSTGDHSALPVPVYAIGAGSEQFTGVMENTELSKRLAELVK